MKRKFIALVLTCLMCASLVACDGGTAGTYQPKNDMFKQQTTNNLLNNPKVKFGGLLN